MSFELRLWDIREKLRDRARDALLQSPPPVRRLLANAGAFGRSLQRGGIQPNDRVDHCPETLSLPLDQLRLLQTKRLRSVVGYAKEHVPHYRQHMPDADIATIDDVRGLPVLFRDALRHDPFNVVADGVLRSLLQLRTTSGSTGTPLRYYHHPETLAHNTAAWQAVLRWYGWRPAEPHAHFGGLPLVSAGVTVPPWWIYVDLWRQLRCSAYHLSPRSFRHYIDEMKRRKVRFGVGYASSWYQLAVMVRDSDVTPPKLRAIVTDSDGLTDDQKELVEEAFGCPVFRTYGCGETGMAMMECSRGHYHEVSPSKLVEVVDDLGEPVTPGKSGRLLVTDLLSRKTPYIRYDTGDLATTVQCDCGWNSPAVRHIEGRADEVIETPSGRRLGRLSHIIKPAAGVVESQIVQCAPDCMEIRVVGTDALDAASMDRVCARARRYVGDDMRISWKQVPFLPRLPNGKLRHVIREG